MEAKSKYPPSIFVSSRRHRLTSLSASEDRAVLLARPVARTTIVFSVPLAPRFNRIDSRVSLTTE